MARQMGFLTILGSKTCPTCQALRTSRALACCPRACRRAFKFLCHSTACCGKTRTRWRPMTMAGWAMRKTEGCGLGQVMQDAGAFVRPESQHVLVFASD